MKLLILSDLHLEHAAFVPSQRVLELADVVVLAGDIHVGARGIHWANWAFGDKPVVYVAGNHEFYDGHWTRTLAELRGAARDHGVHFLEDEAVEIKGIRFLGCTLWTDFAYSGEEQRNQAMREAQRAMMDFRAIEADPQHEVYEGSRRQRLTALHTLKRHEDSRTWLERELALAEPKETVVVTHHAPHHLSVSPRFIGSRLNPAYVSDLPNDLLGRAGLWIHGHTHSTAYYFVNCGGAQTRVACNPRGYPMFGGGWENVDFDPDLLLEC
jgi:predicted phosphodiesterase